MHNNQRNLVNGYHQIEVSCNSSENREIQILPCNQIVSENNLEHSNLQEEIISPSWISLPSWRQAGSPRFRMRHMTTLLLAGALPDAHWQRLCPGNTRYCCWREEGLHMATATSHYWRTSTFAWPMFHQNHQHKVLSPRMVWSMPVQRSWVVEPVSTPASTAGQNQGTQLSYSFFLENAGELCIISLRRNNCHILYIVFYFTPIWPH